MLIAIVVIGLVALVLLAVLIGLIRGNEVGAVEDGSTTPRRTDETSR